MNMDGQKQTYEQFKADIFQWKDTHREEYRRFAKMMADGNEMQYLAVCRAIFKQLPGIKKEWQMSWCDDSTDAFRNIGLHFKDNAVPGQIVELYRKQREEDATTPPSSFWGKVKSFFRDMSGHVTLSAPLVLSWLYYGKSFEAMVDMVSRQAGHPKAGWVIVMPIPEITRQKRQTPATARHRRHSGQQERRRYRNGLSRIISNAKRRRLSCNVSAVSCPSTRAQSIRHSRSMC